LRKISKKLTAAINLGTVILNESMFMAAVAEKGRQMSKMVHGRKHELVFETPPDGNQMLQAVDYVLGGGPLAWRCLSISPDKLTYVIEEVDIWQTLEPYTPTDRTIPVKVYLKCRNCETGYDVWRLQHLDHGKVKMPYNHYTDHCPSCPPMSVNVWLTDIGFWPEPPPEALPPSADVTMNKATAKQPTLSISDDELAEFE
jgi:hypothetical protein